MSVADGEGMIAAAAAHPEAEASPPDALRQRIAELEAGIAARDAFLAVAAHELRNPMTPIVGQVQRLHRLVAKGGCSLEEVAAGLARIQGLIDLYLKRATTLLDVSRITTGRLRLEIASVDVGAVLRDSAAALEPSAQHAGSAMTLRLADDLVIATDRLAIEQICDNLLLNAVKYGAGRPIEAAAMRVGARLQLTVRDHGIGMSQADQQRIFQPFERAISYGATAGFGVGLWVVRQLIDAMGGDILVESVIDAGTTFTVTIPPAVTQDHV